MTEQHITLALISLQVVIGLVELAVTLDKKFKARTEKVLHIPEENREP